MHNETVFFLPCQNKNTNLKAKQAHFPRVDKLLNLSSQKSFNKTGLDPIAFNMEKLV